MAENNQTNDIAEMLMKLRRSVEADRAKAENEKSDETKEKPESDDELIAELSQTMKNAEKAADHETEEDIEEDIEEEDDDPWFDGDPEDEELDDEEDEGEPEDDDGLDIEIASAEEREVEDDDEDPWFSASADESEDTVEDEKDVLEYIEETERAEEAEEIEEAEAAVEVLSCDDAPDDDDVLTAEMIAEAEAEEEDEPEDEDENMPYWYQIESERRGPAERDDAELEREADEDEGGSLFDFDDFAYGEEPPEYLTNSEEEPEETAEEAYEEEPEETVEEAYEEEPEETAEETYEEEPEETAEEVYEEESFLDDEDMELELAETDESEHDGLDETDLELLHQLGYTSIEGTEEVVKQEEQEKVSFEPAGDLVNDREGEDYVVKKQREDIKIEYAEQKKNILLRLIIAGAAGLLLLIYESLTFAGVTLPWIFDQHAYPLSHAMISLQLLLIAAAMSLKMISKGVVDAFCLRATPYSVCSTMVLLNVIYTVVIAIISPEKYMLFNLAPAFSVAVAIAYEYILTLNEEKAFDAVSDEKAEKYVLVEDEDSEKPFGDEPALRAYRTDFNKSFFTYVGRRSAEYKYIGIFIPAVAGLALVILIAVWIATGNGSEAAKAAMLTVNFALPLGVMGTFSLPMLGALISFDKKGAVLGHSAVDNYENTRFVTFDETDMFPSIKTTYIDLKPAGNSHISEVLGKTSRLFSAIGGPLSRMVETRESGDDGEGVTITGIFDDGVSADVDSVKMLAGSARFLEINGVETSAVRDHRDADTSNEILYIAIDGKLSARYYIKYLPDPDFVETVNLLGDRGISVGIRTRNPGVNSRIIEKRCPEMKYKVYTVRSVADSEKDLNSYKSVTESEMVAHGKACRLVYPLIAALALKKCYKADMYVRIISAIVGVFTVIAFVGMGRVGDIGAFWAVAYQLIWLVPSAFAMLLMMKKKGKDR